jgi:hypothetical protein
LLVRSFMLAPLLLARAQSVRSPERHAAKNEPFAAGSENRSRNLSRPARGRSGRPRHANRIATQDADPGTPPRHALPRRPATPVATRRSTPTAAATYRARRSAYRPARRAGHGSRGARRGGPADRAASIAPPGGEGGDPWLTIRSSAASYVPVMGPRHVRRDARRLAGNDPGRRFAWRAGLGLSTGRATVTGTGTLGVTSRRDGWKTVRGGVEGGSRCGPGWRGGRFPLRGGDPPNVPGGWRGRSA